MDFEGLQYAAPRSGGKSKDSKETVGVAPTRIFDSWRSPVGRLDIECRGAGHEKSALSRLSYAR